MLRVMTTEKLPISRVSHNHIRTHLLSFDCWKNYALLLIAVTGGSEAYSAVEHSTTPGTVKYEIKTNGDVPLVSHNTASLN